MEGKAVVMTAYSDKYDNEICLEPTHNACETRETRKSHFAKAKLT